MLNLVEINKWPQYTRDFKNGGKIEQFSKIWQEKQIKIHPVNL